MSLPSLLPDRLRTRLEQGVQRRAAGYRGRYAPSPSGVLHRGNLRTALLSWLDARLAGGVWLLRIDDLDTPRVVPGAEQQILADLRWLGLTWDGPPLRQSERRGLYSDVLSALRRGGALYPCRCSRRLLADVSAPHGALSVYPGFCRGLAPQWGPLGARLPSWRLRLPPGQLCWSERLAVAGAVDAAAQVGDVVLRRADGYIAYHLATAVDELELGISDVVRGGDLWPATAAQVAVMRQLGFAAPRYGHVPLWCDADGQRLSKRDGSDGLEVARRQGDDAAAVIGQLAATLALVPAGSRLSSQELLEDLRSRSASQPPGSDPLALALAGAAKT